MYGLHNSWLGLFMCSALPWLVILAIGATCTLWADGRWNPATQMSPPFDKVLIGHFSPESAGVATPSVVARNLISKMPGSRRYELVRRLIMTLLLIISACVLFFIFIVRMTLGTLRTLRFSQQRHEPYYALGEGGTEMLPQHVTLMVSAVIYSVVYWSMSLWSLDVGWYLATGRVLWLPAMAWSLQFVRLNVVAAGVPPLLASWLVYGTVALLCSPGLFLPVIALTRLGRGGFCEILRFVRARPLSKSCLSTHAAFLLRLCQELHIRPPRVVCDPHGDLHIYTEHSWLHRGGYLIVSHGCLPWLCEKEVDAVLAHEMHHLAHDRFRLAVLKAASVLLLSPMYYLTILFDFAHAERRADAFAVTTVKEASVLRSALVKLDIFSIRSSNATSERIQARAWGHVLQRISQLAAMGRYLRMLYTDEIVGAAYPPLSQRLAWIRTAVEEKDEHRLPK